MIGLGLSAFAEGADTITDTTSIASPSVEFTAVNAFGSPAAASSYGMGVTCAEPTLNLEGSRYGANTKGGSIGMAIPLGAAFDFDSCEKSARQVRWMREQDRMDREHAKQKRDEMHDLDIAVKRMKFYNDFCKSAHGSMSLDKNTYEYKICNSVVFLVDRHNPKMNVSLMPDNHGRVSPTKGSWGE